MPCFALLMHPMTTLYAIWKVFWIERRIKRRYGPGSLNGECEARHSRRLPAEKFISLNLQNIALIYTLISLIYTLISLLYTLISLLYTFIARDLQNIALYQYIVIHNARSKQIIQIFTQLTLVFIVSAVF